MHRTSPTSAGRFGRYAPGVRLRCACVFIFIVRSAATRVLAAACASSARLDDGWETAEPDAGGFDRDALCAAPFGSASHSAFEGRSRAEAGDYLPWSITGSSNLGRRELNARRDYLRTRATKRW